MAAKRDLGAPDDTWRWALTITLAFLALRIAILLASPVQLYPDEAQYWVWSRQLAFGYVSKPPMIAWLIGLTTALFGNAEPFVRLSSPLLHAAAGLFIYAAGRRLYGAATGLLGLVFYTLMPAVQLAAFVVSTDTPLVAFLAVALWLYVVVLQSEGRRATVAAAAFGLALGLAFLSKYAALYALIGVALHLTTAPAARRAWRMGAAGAAVLAFALTVAPNLAWNATHHFATVAHVAFNAAWRRQPPFRLDHLLSFLAGQLAVFGPGPFLLLVGGGAVLAIRRRLLAPDLLLLCWTLPPLVILSVQAFIAQGNANWAAAAYVPATILVAAWLVRWRIRWFIAGTIALHAAAAAAFMAGAVQPRLADAVGAGSALERVRGWRETEQALEALAQTASLAGPLTAAAVDDRSLFDETAYYGRDFLGHRGLRLGILPEDATPSDHALAAPLTAAESRRVLVASFLGYSTQSVTKVSARIEDLEILSLRLDARHSRRTDVFVADGLR